MSTSKARPARRGFQHGYLLAKEIAQGIKATRADWEYESATKWTWLLDKASAMFVRKIDKENLAELDGIVEGMQAAGVPSSRAEIIAYNAYLELRLVLVAGGTEEDQRRKSEAGASILQRVHCHRQHDG